MSEVQAVLQRYGIQVASYMALIKQKTVLNDWNKWLLKYRWK